MSVRLSELNDKAKNNLNSTNITTGGIVCNSLISSNTLNAPFNSNTIGPLIFSGGNIGIGASPLPSYLLDVNGTIKANTFTGGNSGSNISGVHASQRLSATTITGANINISDNIIIGSSITVGNYIQSGTITGTTLQENGTNILTKYANVGHLHTGVYYPLAGNTTISGAFVVNGTLYSLGEVGTYGVPIFANSYRTIGGISYFSSYQTLSSRAYGYLTLRNYGSGNFAENATFTGVVPCTIETTSRIAATEFNLTSDIRIKKDIIDINDMSALEKVRLIQPKKYKYVDEYMEGTEPVWGFIAQQVDEILPYAVNTENGYIPNIYENATVTNSEGGSIITLNEKTTEALSYNNSYNNELKVMVRINGTKCLKLKIKEILDNKSFIVDSNIQESEIFVFGQEVKDFKKINKDNIFTMAVAGLQEVDRQLQISKTDINNNITNINTYENRLNTIDDKIRDVNIYINNLSNRMVIANI